jgi:hypothetical protein
MNKNLLKVAVSAGVVLPFFAYAATAFTVLTTIEDIIARVIPIIMAVATVVFLWGIVMYITAAGDEKKAATAKSFISSGLIGLFFMVAIWGIVKALVNTFGVGGEGIPTGPGR